MVPLLKTDGCLLKTDGYLLKTDGYLKERMVSRVKEVKDARR